MSLDGLIAGPNGEADWIVLDPRFDFTGAVRHHAGPPHFEEAGGMDAPRPEMKGNRLLTDAHDRLLRVEIVGPSCTSRNIDQTLLNRDLDQR